MKGCFVSYLFLIIFRLFKFHVHICFNKININRQFLSRGHFSFDIIWRKIINIITLLKGKSSQSKEALQNYFPFERSYKTTNSFENKWIFFKISNVKLPSNIFWFFKHIFIHWSSLTSCHQQPEKYKNRTKNTIFSKLNIHCRIFFQRNQRENNVFY